ncbi:hypothetical protein CTEN210_03577 [Chaetoceros tenuissimus]|uniref:Leucine-rich repeat domain-containing protein n=1 Tax=Chaetoceros tenuissimus TaxID=426638 RepID=A0AAD3H1H2_9STRA|nr:hypothetical protein CTEN210_03577 [Chaetoceros tenuissimus]
MKVQTEEWRRFIPGVRMYKDKKTLFYNGEKLWEGDGSSGRPLIYDEEERNTWQVVIILPGVEVIPEWTFWSCKNIKTVIMADTVRRIEYKAFFGCDSLVFVGLSKNLEYIGYAAFYWCESLTSIFIPPSCREIDDEVFERCRKLIILGLPQNVQLGAGVFQCTLLMTKSPLELDEDGEYNEEDEEAAVQWVKSINNEEAYALHRACSSFNPLPEIIHALVKRQGLSGMRSPNTIGITPSQYLAANTFADISENNVINSYILDMMGEAL